MLAQQPALHNRFAARSLRRTLIFYVMLGCLLPLVLVGFLTYSSIYAIFSNKIQSGISASLGQEAVNLENAINNLDFASKQFALDGQIVDEVSDFLQERQISRKSQMMTAIDQKINLVNFTNPYLGLTAYIMPGEENPVLFSNLAMNPNFDSKVLPLFIHYNGADYYGPHQTQYNSSNNMVFSEQRIVRVGGEQKLYIYLETNYNLFRSILQQQTYGMKVTHVLVNEQGSMTYMEDESMPMQVRKAVDAGFPELHKEVADYHLFRYPSAQGWQLIAVVSKSAFNSEMYAWLSKMLVLACSTLVFALLLALFIWKQIYRPLRKVNVEIVRMAENRTSPVSFTNVEEFDFVLNNFQNMKTTVNDLIAEVAYKEKQKGQFEIEKLLSQINPHFLHNTLNTVQWLARMNGQKEIDKLVTLLVKVLHYNLGKQSLIVTVNEEIEAMTNYMELQRIRYDYEFEFQLKVAGGVLQVAVPRFLLQPLVENAIYHGMSDRTGRIVITIEPVGDTEMLLRVEDNGSGIEPETIAKLLSGDDSKAKRGLGIGLSYVNRMLRQFYNEQMQFRIESELGQGTVVTIVIPRKTKEEFDD
ncbi:two-component system, sensor histidine kinase YesM [Paenibacillus algorifonticola]|uniref:histidine kinase n=1 Tax=Paenibacillus algorifonticola TaxID=684063 RepID=A0A1I1ZW89_9BACL|nr:histidine kinase [Paenibacillus algorifonticola]SFE34893.1 two-component system, sensor histidine kinase YesM [Paenibacillus algorifonticola]